MYRCRITVLRKDFYPEIAKKYAPFTTRDCELMNVGDTFITTGPFGDGMPEGFCPDAWTAIECYVKILSNGGKVYGFDDRHVTCCNDGTRPVYFYLERIEEEDSVPVKMMRKEIGG